MEGTGSIHMIGGNGDESYAHNSSLQLEAISIVKPIMEEAIKDVYNRLLPKTLSISDMGCSTGPNTFYAVSQLVEAVQSLHHQSLSPEFLIHLNDLPSNDFNTIFRSLPEFQENMKKKKHVGPITCFVNGVPGSFYDRLFPSQSLHFVHSSNSLHWLSQAPEGADGNKGNIYISSTSPPNVVNAYLKQYKKDFSAFLGHRAVELVAGGSMVLTMVRRRVENPAAWESQSIFGPLSITINSMVNEGLIEEEKLDAFNVPLYLPSIEELKAVVEDERSFKITRMVLHDVSMNVDALSSSDSPDDDVLKIAGQSLVKGFRAASEPLLSNHFGEDVMDEMFIRLAVDVTHDFISKDKYKVLHNVTLVLTKRG